MQDPVRPSKHTVMRVTRFYLAHSSFTKSDRQAFDVVAGGSPAQVAGQTLEGALGGRVLGLPHGRVHGIDLEGACLCKVHHVQSSVSFLL